MQREKRRLYQNNKRKIARRLSHNMAKQTGKKAPNGFLTDEWGKIHLAKEIKVSKMEANSKKRAEERRKNATKKSQAIEAGI